MAIYLGNFLVSKEPPHRPILLDFGLTKLLTNSMKQGLAKMFLASVEVGNLFTKIKNNEKIVSANILVDYRAPRIYLSHNMVLKVE